MRNCRHWPPRRLTIGWCRPTSKRPFAIGGPTTSAFRKSRAVWLSLVPHQVAESRVPEGELRIDAGTILIISLNVHHPESALDDTDLRRSRTIPVARDRRFPGRAVIEVLVACHPGVGTHGVEVPGSVAK